jgi:hypothetical protein
MSKYHFNELFVGDASKADNFECGEEGAYALIVGGFDKFGWMSSHSTYAIDELIEFEFLTLILIELMKEFLSP